MKVDECGRNLGIAVLGWVMAGTALGETPKPATSAVQNQPSRAAVAALPHGKCPANYRLEFVSATWIGCTLNAGAAQGAKQPVHAAPTCDGGYALQDAAASKAPERHLYRCVKT